jgi:hypothetical protein
VAFADFVSVLSRLNVELNGETPSESAGTGPATISTDVAYAVAEVSRILREKADATSSPEARDGAWRVDTAWLAVLAGDIDNLEQHLADEAEAR